MTLMDKLKHTLGGDAVHDEHNTTHGSGTTGTHSGHHHGHHDKSTYPDDPRDKSVPMGSGGSHTHDATHITDGDKFQHTNLGVREGATAGRNEYAAHGYPDSSSTTSHSTGHGLSDKGAAAIASGTSGRDHLTENTPTTRSGREYTDSSTTGLGHSSGKTGGLTSARDEYTLGSGATPGRDPYDQTGAGVGGVGSGLTGGSRTGDYGGPGSSSTSGMGSSTTNGLGSSTIGSGSGTYGGGNVDHQMFHPMGKDGSGYSAEHLAEHTGHMSHSHGGGHGLGSSTGTGAGVIPAGSSMGSGIGSSTGADGLSSRAHATSGHTGGHAGSGLTGSTTDSGMTDNRGHYEAGDMPGRTKGVTDQDAYGSAARLGSARDGYAGRAGGVADENNTLRR